MNWIGKGLLAVLLLTASCGIGETIAALETNSAPSEAQTSAFIAEVRRAIEASDMKAFRRLSASSAPSPFHQPIFLSYLDRFPTNSFPYGSCMVELKERRDDDDGALWHPKPLMTLRIEIRTPTFGYGLSHPVGLLRGELKLCDRIDQNTKAPPSPPPAP